MKLGLKVNKKELLNTTLGILAVKYAPELLKKVLPEYANGITGNLLAGAIGVGVGVVMKSPVIQTVAIATAVTEIVADNFLDSALASVTGSGTTTQATTMQGLKNYTKLNNSLRDYPKLLSVNRNYKAAYQS